MNWLERHLILIYILVIVILICGTSCSYKINDDSYIDYTYSVYQFQQPEDKPSDINLYYVPAFSFEYPDKLFKPSKPQGFYTLSIAEERIFSGHFSLRATHSLTTDSSVSVLVYNQRGTEILMKDCGLTKDGFIDYIDKYGDRIGSFGSQYSTYRKSEITYTSIMNLPARQHFFKTEESHVHGVTKKTAFSVDFIHDGRLWVIYYIRFDTDITNPPAYFNHLLETFKIYNEGYPFSQ